MQIIFIKFDARKTALYSCLACILIYILYILFLIPTPNRIIKNRNTHKTKRVHYDIEDISLDSLINQDNGDEFEKVVAPFLVVRVSGTEANRRVQQHIEDYMTNLRWTLQTDYFIDSTPYGHKQFTNVIATQNPKAKRKLILACHFDSKYFAEFEFIAATDSAVPCAIIMLIAARLNQALEEEKSKDISLQLVFFDGEEAFKQWTSTDSLYGSRHLAKLWQSTPDKNGDKNSETIMDNIELLVLLDLMGQKGAQYHSWFSDTDHIFNNLQNIEKRLKLNNSLMKSKHTYFPKTNLLNSGGIQDDHIPFLEKGVPILHMISYPFPKQWHTIQDNASIIDTNTVKNMELIFRIFVAEYLHLTIR